MFGRYDHAKLDYFMRLARSVFSNNPNMNRTFVESLTLIDTTFWIVCFWWMHRISSRQDAMLNELREQAHRIEKLSKAEHDLVKDLHPKVHKIEANVDEVATAVRTDQDAIS